ncbi:hypothetical protein MHBO_003767 [Bonamia ostreae]|uniref:Uncharacterized protein n=1 Tax=Bonamia ostreae TaxID=126728 RepID=A0ABV2ARZ6_9EUKA
MAFIKFIFVLLSAITFVKNDNDNTEINAETSTNHNRSSIPSIQNPYICNVNDIPDGFKDYWQNYTILNDINVAKNLIRRWFLFDVDNNYMPILHFYCVDGKYAHFVNIRDYEPFGYALCVNGHFLPPPLCLDLPESESESK